MTDFLFETGLINNLALIIIVVGYLAVGLAFGFVAGYDKGNKKGFTEGNKKGFTEGVDAGKAFARSWDSHPSNR